MLAGCPIVYSSKRQPCIALSSTEAEIIAASTTAAEICYVRTLLAEMGLEQEPGVATPPTRLTGMMVTARVADSGLSSMVP